MRKLFSVFTSLVFLTNSLLYPFSFVYAQEVTLTPEPTFESTPEPTPVVEEMAILLIESTPEPTFEPIIGPVLDPGPTFIPTFTPTSTFTPTPTFISILTPTPIPTSASTQSPLLWTYENVELNKEYIAPQNGAVKLTFTKLPTPSGNIKIEEITLSEEQIKQTGSLSDKAYDITSNMVDGTFAYNLSLPIPDSSKGKDVKVKFAEELADISSAKQVTNSVSKSDTSVSVNNLDHFTILFTVASGGNIAATQINTGSVNPSININLTDDTFTASEISNLVANWTINTGTTNLAVGTLTRTSNILMSIAFTGTATPGIVSVQANAAALLISDIPSNTVSVSVLDKINQAITFGELSSKTDTDSNFSISATADSGLPVSFSSLTTSICTIVSSSTVHLVTAGTCTIRAGQSGNADYNTAPNVDRSFSITDTTPPSIVFGTYNVSQEIISPNGDGTKDSVTIEISFSEQVSAVVNIMNDLGNLVKKIYQSSGAVTNTGAFTWDGKNTEGVFVDDGLYYIDVGMTDVSNNHSDNTDRQIRVDNTPPVITLNGDNPQIIEFGGTYVPLSATANDVVSGSSAASSSGTVDTSVIGPYVITYTASDAAGNPAIPVVRTVNVVKANQTITFGAAPDKTYGDDDFGVSATASSGLAVSFSSSTLSVCTVSSSTVHIVTAGSCTIVGSQSGNSNYNAAPDTDQLLTIVRANSQSYITCDPKTYTYTASAITPCTGQTWGLEVFMSTFTPNYSNNVSVGMATVNYTFPGDVNFNGSGDDEKFSITKANASITVDGYTGVYDGDPHSASVGSALGVNSEDLTSSINLGSSFTLVPGGTAHWTFFNVNYNDQSGDVAITITKDTSSTAITCPADQTYTGSPLTPCTVLVTGSGDLNLTPTPIYTNNTDVGTATVSYTFADDGNHTGSTDTKTFEITKADSLTTVTCPASVAYTGSAITPCTVSVTGAGGLNLTPTPDYINNTGVGTASASYTFAGDSTHNSSTDSATFDIGKVDQTITFGILPDKIYGASNFSVSATSTSGLAVSISSQDPSICTVTGSNVHLVKVGTCTVIAMQSGDDSYNAASNVNQSFSITKADPTIMVTPYSVIYDANPHTAVGSAKGVFDEDLTGLVVSNTTHTDVGDYPSDAWTFIDTTGNYNDDSGTVHNAITQKEITVTADTLSKERGDADPALTYVSSPSLFGSDVFAGFLTREIGENVGTYAIIQGTLLLGSNYLLNYVGANLTISDTTAPTLTTVSMLSNNANQAYAKTGHTITLTFTSSETINTPTVTILGQSATVSNLGGNNWQSTYLTIGIETEGLVPFTIDFSDVSGNDGVQVTATTDSSSVTYDTTNPTNVTPSTTTPTNSTSQTWDWTAATDLNSITGYSWRTSDGQTGTTTNTFQVTSFLEGIWSFFVKAIDNAGNEGNESEGTVTVDTTAPEGNWVAPVADTTVSGVVTLNFSATDSSSDVNSISFWYKQNDGIDDFHSTGSNWDTNTLTLDVYTLKAVVTDNAGNSTEFEQSVNVSAILSEESSTTPSADSAVITWITDKPTKSRVIYDKVSHPILGDASNYGYAWSTGTSDTSPKVISHSVMIGGLSDGTVYYYRVISEGSPVTVGSEKEFKTLSIAGAPDSTGGADGQVAGISTVALSNYQYNQTNKTGNSVLDDEPPIIGSSTSPIPETKGTSTSSFNWWMVIAPSLLVLIILEVLRRKKKSLRKK